MSDGVPPETSDPLLTPTHTPQYSDWTLYTSLYRYWGVPLDEAEERVKGMTGRERGELARRVRAARLNKQ